MTVVQGGGRETAPSPLTVLEIADRIITILSEARCSHMQLAQEIGVSGHKITKAIPVVNELVHDQGQLITRRGGEYELVRDLVPYYQSPLTVDELIKKLRKLPKDWLVDPDASILIGPAHHDQFGRLDGFGGAEQAQFFADPVIPTSVEKAGKGTPHGLSLRAAVEGECPGPFDRCYRPVVEGSEYCQDCGDEFAKNRLCQLRQDALGYGWRRDPQAALEELTRLSPESAEEVRGQLAERAKAAEVRKAEAEVRKAQAEAERAAAAERSYERARERVVDPEAAAKRSRDIAANWAAEQDRAKKAELARKVREYNETVLWGSDQDAMSE